MRDLKLKNPKLRKLIDAENNRQLKKWGIQDRLIEEWFLFLGEELGELAQAISEWNYRSGDPEQVVKEAIQTAVLSLKIAEMFMKED